MSRILKNDLGYSLLKANYKNKETKKDHLAIIQSDHPDRYQQFQYINRKKDDFIKKGLPVISVDTKKKEKLGNFKNSGTVWTKKGESIEVNSHDFGDKDTLIICPYGVQDVGKNKGFVKVGIESVP